MPRLMKDRERRGKRGQKKGVKGKRGEGKGMREMRGIMREKKEKTEVKGYFKGRKG